MINISRNRYLDTIKEFWLNCIKEFFVNSGYNSYINVAGNKRLYFNSYKQKLKFECLQVVFANTIGNKRLRNVYVKTLKYWWNHLDSIILASLVEMNSCTKRWNKKSNGSITLQRLLGKIFTHYYDIVSNKFGGDLVTKLNVKTCPYCNRQFIYTYKGSFMERPELDHFYPKAKYPIFCLSFYNLIPACHSCNHIKSENIIGVNPYESAFKGNFILKGKNGNKLNNSQIYKLTKNEIEIDFEGGNKLEDSNVDVFGLKHVYNKHADYIKELIDKSMAYDEYAKKALVESFHGVGYSPVQVYDFVWGRHLSNAEHEDRPLSKLTRDILDLLNIRRYKMR